MMPGNECSEMYIEYMYAYSANIIHEFILKPAGSAAPVNIKSIKIIK